MNFKPDPIDNRYVLSGNGNTQGRIPRHVVCAAIKRGPIMVTGPRHLDFIMQSQIDSMKFSLKSRWSIGEGIEEMGFIDQFGNFMTREVAMQVAQSFGQLKAEIPMDKILFSTDIY